MKKLIILFLPIITLTVILCACTQRAVNSKQDELKVNSWKGIGEYSTTVSLKFKGTKANFDIQSMGGAKTSLCGDCIVDENKILLTDSHLKKSIEFYYKIDGDKMTLTYKGGTINLNKDK